MTGHPQDFNELTVIDAYLYKHVNSSGGRRIYAFRREQLFRIQAGCSKVGARCDLFQTLNICVVIVSDRLRGILL